MVKRRVSILRNKKGHPIYSREDIREQYCINKKEEEVLENARTSRFFGCLANQQDSPCTKNSILFSCMHKKATSDDNLYVPEPPAEWTSSSKDAEEDEYASSGFRRRPRTFCVTDPRLWTDGDEHGRTKPKLASSASLGSQYSTDSEVMLRYMQRPSQLSIGRQEIAPSQSVDALNDTYSRRELYRRGIKTPDLSLDERRPKHVSFDSSSMIRSNTVAGGLEEVDIGPAATSTPLNSQKRTFSPTERHHSQERLLDISGSKSLDLIMPRQLVIKPRRAMLKTQATQTELTFKARFMLPAYLTLSPRATTQYRQKLRSQRHRSASRLTKSRSAHGVLETDDSEEEIMEVELINKHPKLGLVRSITKHTLTTHMSLDCQQEIMVSFKPVSPPKAKREVLIGERPKMTRYETGKEKISKMTSPPPIMTSSDSAPSIPVDSQSITTALPEDADDLTDKAYSEGYEFEPQPEGLIKRDSSSSMISSETSSLPQSKPRFYVTALMDNVHESSSAKSSSDVSRLRMSDDFSPIQLSDMDTESPTVTTDGGIPEISHITITSPLEMHPGIIKQEIMTSPDSESSSSIFTERETSRSELSTSSSSRVVKSEPSVKSDADGEEVSESSEYITATDHSYQTKREKTQKSKNSTEEGHTSFESASSASLFSSPSSRSSQLRSPVHLPRDDGESSDESTKKEAVSSDSESGQMSPIQEGPDERAQDVTPVPDPSPEQSSLQDAQTVIENRSDATSEEMLESISSSPLNREEESESSDNSSVFSGVQTELPPLRILRAEDISEPSEELSQQLEQRRQFHLLIKTEGKHNGVRSSSSDYLPSETTTPSYDSTTSGSFILESIGAETLSEESAITPELLSAQMSIAESVIASKDQEFGEIELQQIVQPAVAVAPEKISETEVLKEHDDEVIGATAQEIQETQFVIPEVSISNAHAFISSDVDASSAVGYTDKEKPSVSYREDTQPKLSVCEGAIPKQRDQDQESVRKKDKIRIKVDTVDSSTYRGPYLSPDDRDLPTRRPRSLSRSPDKAEDDIDQKFLCSQCGEKLKETAISPFGWDRSFQRQFWDQSADLLRHRERPAGGYGDGYGFPGTRFPPYSPRWSELPVAPGPEEEEEDAGVHMDSYRISLWIYVSESDELAVWKTPLITDEGQQPSSAVESKPSLERSDSTESTSSEQDFLKQYQAVTHRMIHRKSSVEMHRRLSNKSFEADKKITIQRNNGEFGFRIHGSKPVVVSAIEKGTPAETCGLEVGDILININGISVLEASHSEVVKTAHTGTDTLHMEVARTCHVLAPVVNQAAQSPLLSGYLQRLSIGGLKAQRWCRRWFLLKPDNSLCWYRTPEDHEPLGALTLQSHEVSRVPDAGSPHAFRVTKYGGSTYYFSADDEDTAARWISALTQVATTASKVDPYLETILRNVQLPPLSVPNPDCSGYLGKLSQRWKTWKRRYFILKDASLYFYTERNATAALGMFLLHGYKVQSCTVSGKKNTYEAIPPEPRLKHLYFLADTENDKKRWLAAFEYSIDRWIKVG